MVSFCYAYPVFKSFVFTVAPNVTTPMEGEKFIITERSSISIICTATGYPVPTVVWQNSDGSSLSNNRLVSGSPVISSTGIGNVSSVSVELMVIGAIRVDSGMYRCSANNSVSSTTRNITITVQCKLWFMCTVCVCTLSLLITVVAPEIIIPPDDTIVINGSEAVLNCTVVGDPLPSIRWIVVSGVDITLLFSIGLETPFDQQGRIYSNVVTNTTLNITTIHSSLRLKEVASFSAGNYACGAFNSLGNVTTTAALTILGK